MSWCADAQGEPELVASADPWIVSSGQHLLFQAAWRWCAAISSAGSIPSGK